MSKTVTELTKGNLREVSELPNLNYSFQLLIQFAEHGMNGEENKHLSTGIWWHVDEYLQINDEEMKDLTPVKFLPLYEDVH